MEITIGILLLITLIIFTIYSVKGGNLLIGFLIMSVIWSIFAMIGGQATFPEVL